MGKRLKIGGSPQFLAIPLPEGVERPALAPSPPAGRSGRSPAAQPPSTVARQHEHGVDPDGPLDAEQAALRRPALQLPYAELARRAGSPGSARAVGAATGRNPIGIIVPCHRIVGSNGALTGYAGGLAKKRALLALEGLNLVR